MTKRLMKASQIKVGDIITGIKTQRGIANLGHYKVTQVSPLMASYSPSILKGYQAPVPVNCEPDDIYEVAR